MLDKIDRALYWPLWVICALVGLALDEIEVRKISRQARRYG